MMALLSLDTNAQTGDNLNYKQKMEVAVTEGSYFGDIVIPQTVQIGGQYYTVTEIADYAFRGCKDVTSISIPLSVTTFGMFAMAGCSYKEISLHYRVKNVGIHSLYCDSLECVVVSEDNEWYRSVDGALYDKDVSILHQFPFAKVLDNYVVPEGVKRFNSGAIEKLKAKVLELPTTFEWLGDWNLMQTPNLSKIIIRSSVIPWCHNSLNKSLCENCILYVPDDMVEDYKNHEEWGSFKNIRPLSEASRVSAPSSVRSKEKGIYGLSGAKRAEMEKGVNIVVKSDGSAAKIIK